MCQYDLMLDLKIEKLVSVTFISWFSDIGLYLEDYLMYKAGTLAGGIREPLLTCSSFLCVKTAVSRGFIGHNKSANFV